MTPQEMKRFAMTTPELAKDVGVKKDGYTWNYSATLYTGDRSTLERFSDALHLQGKRFNWTADDCIAVEG